LGKFAKGVFFANPSFVGRPSSIPFPQHDPPPHKRLLRSLAFKCVGEYFWATHVVTPFSFTPTSFVTTLALIALHPKLDGYLSLFLKDYELDHDFDFQFSYDSFKLVF
jgi:hypothetical protein